MDRIVLLVLATALFAAAALAQGAPVYDDAADVRSELSSALAEREAAEQRAERFAQEAAGAQDAATRTAREAAALAAQVQQAEAGIAAARARIAIFDANQAALRERIGREQQPVVRLTAALQQFSRRPLALAVLRPGSVKDVVYLRAMMHDALPQVQQRTAGLRARVAESRRLRAAALAAAQQLEAEEHALANRRRELAEVESRQRLAARAATGSADREAERALALAEQARDLDGLVDELDRAAALRRRLAALPGPRLRPANPAAAAAVAEPAAPAATAQAGAPSDYILPVAGRVVTGFGAPQDGGASPGLSLAPLAGAQVVAPAGGRVAFAGPYRGYGQIVIIEHGGGWTSLITGLGRAEVQVGAEIAGGAPLGVAGPGRPVVSLELRRDGEAVNPLLYTR